MSDMQRLISWWMVGSESVASLGLEMVVQVLPSVSKMAGQSGYWMLEAEMSCLIFAGSVRVYVFLVPTPGMGVMMPPQVSSAMTLLMTPQEKLQTLVSSCTLQVGVLSRARMISARAVVP